MSVESNFVGLFSLSPQIWDALLLPALLGGVGGLTRGFVGLLKALSLKRRVIWNY